jgi:hypothetical protein
VTSHSPASDVIHDPVLKDHLWIAIASQPLAGQGKAAWVDGTLPAMSSADECSLPGDDIAVDGSQGATCAPSVAAVAAADRGYLIWLYGPEDAPSAGVMYDRAWFDQVLGTVQLQPEEAIDAVP